MSNQENYENAARRARVIASDLAIYPDIQKKIEIGIKNDTLFEELSGVLEQARGSFANYYDDDIVNGTNILEREIIDAIFAESGYVDSEIW